MERQTESKNKDLLLAFQTEKEVFFVANFKTRETQVTLRFPNTYAQLRSNRTRRSCNR